MATWVVILISAGLGILGTGRALLHSKFSKSYARNEYDIGKLIFWSLVLSALCLLPIVIITRQWDEKTILWGLIAGLFNGIYQYCYSFTLKKGPMGLSILMNQLAMIFPVIFSVLRYGEAFTAFRIIATVLIIVSFFLNVRKDNKTKTSMKWFILAVLTMSFNASICIVYKFFTEFKLYEGANYGFVMFTYIGAIAVSIILFIYWRTRASIKYKHALKNKAPNEEVKNPLNGYKMFEKPNKHQVIFTIFLALNMAIYDTLDVLCVAYFDGPIYFPMVQGITLILSIFAGMIFYKEKHNILQYISIGFVIVAIVLLAIPIH